MSQIRQDAIERHFIFCGPQTQPLPQQQPCNSDRAQILQNQVQSHPVALGVSPNRKTHVSAQGSNAARTHR
ncbi:hypothetical protein H6F85_14520 [Microcoleus sp. FACHB-45]|nr:hypothetical protein [Microcoleus sp. FACHB-DQ6]MBD1883032.1 hypothetical protein [Microcoleus sp. FACHB-84]MBD2009932.1 hypothetical protein [Microcoleus sp. FACHB-45]